MFRVLTNIMCELRFSPDYLVHPLLNFRNKSESMFPFQYTEPKLGAVENFARGGGQIFARSGISMQYIVNIC